MLILLLRAKSGEQILETVGDVVQYEFERTGKLSVIRRAAF